MLKKILSICLVWLTALNVHSAVSVRITSGLDNATLKSKMELTMSQLLTEINQAQQSNRALQFSALGIPQRVQVSLSMLWENSPFLCTENTLEKKCITTNDGYQFRGIPLQMMPIDGTKLDKDEQYQEAVISFDCKGELLSFYFSLSTNQYMQVIKENKGLNDLRRRQIILDFTERFRTSYNTKDTIFMKQIFSEDALIITGYVIQQKPLDGIKIPDKITYKKQNKQEYLTNLRAVFAKNSFIRVTFDDIQILTHPIDKTIFGVTLRQGYSSSNYHDDGYLFLLWDFKDENHPQILVRTWQPDQINGGELPKTEVFSLADFEI